MDIKNSAQGYWQSLGKWSSPKLLHLGLADWLPMRQKIKLKMNSKTSCLSGAEN
jgi:hypothetical protein